MPVFQSARFLFTKAFILLNMCWEVFHIQVNLCQKLLFLHQLTHYDELLFIELQVQYMKIPSSNLGRTCCVQKLFMTLRTIFVHNMFSPCSAKRRASDTDLPVHIISNSAQCKFRAKIVTYCPLFYTFSPSCLLDFQNKSTLLDY